MRLSSNSKIALNSLSYGTSIALVNVYKGWEMKHLMIIAIFLMGSVAFGSNQSDYSRRFANALNMAETSLTLDGDVDRFKLILEIAIDDLKKTADSVAKERNIEAVNSLIESAEGSIEPEVYDGLKSRVNVL